MMRDPRLTAGAMTKYLFHELGWDAEVATHAAKQAGGDWNQLALYSPETACAQGTKDDFSLCSAPPSFVANQVLNGVAPADCATDPRVVAWVDANLGLHCASVEEMAHKQELMATSAGWCFDGNPIGPELFVRAAQHKAARVQYADGKYINPWEHDQGEVREIGDSFKRRRTTYASSLKERALLDESSKDDFRAVAKKAAKSRAKAKAKGKARSKAKDVAMSKPERGAA